MQLNQVMERVHAAYPDEHAGEQCEQETQSACGRAADTPEEHIGTALHCAIKALNHDDAYMVLNDGETYSGLRGCKIVVVKGANSQTDMDSVIKYGEDPDGHSAVSVETLWRFE